MKAIAIDPTITELNKILLVRINLIPISPSLLLPLIASFVSVNEFMLSLIALEQIPGSGLGAHFDLC